MKYVAVITFFAAVGLFGCTPTDTSESRSSHPRGPVIAREILDLLPYGLMKKQYDAPELLHDWVKNTLALSEALGVGDDRAWAAWIKDYQYIAYNQVRQQPGFDHYFFLWNGLTFFSQFKSPFNTPFRMTFLNLETELFYMPGDSVRTPTLVPVFNVNCYNGGERNGGLVCEDVLTERKLTSAQLDRLPYMSRLHEYYVVNGGSNVECIDEICFLRTDSTDVPNVLGKKQEESSLLDNYSKDCMLSGRAYFECK